MMYLNSQFVKYERINRIKKLKKIIIINPS